MRVRRGQWAQREGRSVRLVVRDVTGILPGEREMVESLWSRTWPPDPDEVRDPESEETPVAAVLLFSGDGALVGACELQDRTISVDGARRRVAGLAGVAVEEVHRGRGHGTRLVRAWMDDARARGYGVGVLFTGPRRRRFYERLGWQVLDGEVTQTWLGEEHPVEGPVMATPLTESVAEEMPLWRTARIHVGIGTW